MSKVLKFAATAVAVVGLAVVTGGAAVGLGLSLATSAFGVSAGALLLGSSVLSAASGLLAKRPKAPATSDNAKDRLNLSVDPRTPRKFVLGRTAMATDIRDQEISADQVYVHRFVVVASHAVSAVEEIWFDDKLAWSAAGGVTSDYAGYLDVTPILEGSAANAINIGPRMGLSRRFTGLAYVYFRYKLTGNTKKTASPFQSSIPSRVTIIGKGARVYDPRLDSTVPGGSGPQRANDQSTWAWNDSAARNPALQLLWYFLGWRINGKLAVGKGIPPARLNLASFITAANLCDEPVTLAAGGTQPRYRTDGVFSEGDPTAVVIDQFKASMNADLDDVDGRLRLIVIHNDLATPVADFSEDDVLGEFGWDQTASLDDTFNVVRGTYIDPSPQSLYQAVDYPEVRIPSPDGIDRIEPVDLQLVQSAAQAQRLAKQRTARMLYSGTFTATFGHRAWKVQRGDVIRMTFKPLGWTNKLFRVVDTAVQVDGQVPMTLREEHPDIYLWDSEDAPAVAPVQPTTYDAVNDPLYKFVNEVAETTAPYAVILTNENHILPADANGNVITYNGASTDVLVFSGGVNVSSDFAPSIVSNPQALTVSIVGDTVTVTGGLDQAEENATLQIRMTGSGTFAGITLDKQFTLTKSRAGADGSPAKLIQLSTTHNVFAYDSTGQVKTQTTTLTAARQNTGAETTQWQLKRIDGTVLVSWRSASALVASGGASTSPDNDTITVSSALFASLLTGNATSGLIYEARLSGSTAIVDRQSIIKIADGANGTLSWKPVLRHAKQDSASTFTILGLGTWNSGSAWPAQPHIGSVEAWPQARASALNNDTGPGTYTMVGLTNGVEAWALYRYNDGSNNVVAGYRVLTGATIITQGPVAANQLLEVAHEGTEIVGYINGTKAGVIASGIPADQAFSLFIASESAGRVFTNVTFSKAGVPGKGNLVGDLTNNSHQVPATSAGVVTSYAGAEGQFEVSYNGEEVTNQCTFSIVSNPQGLSVPNAGFTQGGAYVINGGFDAGEDVAAVTFRATHPTYGSVDKVFSLSKSKAGADGLSPALISLALSKGRAHYDKNNNYIGGAIQATATRQNTTGVALFTIFNHAGVALTNALTPAEFQAAVPSYYSAASADALVLSPLFVTEVMANHGGTEGKILIRAHLSNNAGVFDLEDIVKVKDGEDGKSTIVQGSADGANWHTGLLSGDIYMRVSVDGGATFGQAVLIKGESGNPGQPGQPGTNGKYTSFVFRISATQPATPGSHTGDPPPGWTDGPTATIAGQVEWWTHADFLNGVQQTGWTAPARTTGADGAQGPGGPQGPQGPQGPAGPAGATTGAYAPRTISIGTFDHPNEVMVPAGGVLNTSLQLVSNIPGSGSNSTFTAQLQFAPVGGGFGVMTNGTGESVARVNEEPALINITGTFTNTASVARAFTIRAVVTRTGGTANTIPSESFFKPGV